MDLATKTRLEYEEQYFGFHSEEFTESYRQLLKDCFEAVVRSVQKLLRKNLVPSVSNPEAVEKAIDEFGSALCADYGQGIEYSLTSTQGKIRDCLNIPDNICLEEDLITKQVENVSVEELENDIKRLKLEYQTVRYMIDTLKEETEIVDKVIPIMEACNRHDEDISIPDTNEP